ncbi:hypothetical protein U1Q18_017682 [Sarracenia purpurea var. burkii]
MRKSNLRGDQQSHDMRMKQIILEEGQGDNKIVTIEAEEIDEAVLRSISSGCCWKVPALAVSLRGSPVQLVCCWKSLRGCSCFYSCSYFIKAAATCWLFWLLLGVAF